MPPQDEQDIETRIAIAEIRRDISYIREQWDEVRKDYENRLRILESSDRKWALAVLVGSAVFTVALKFLV